MLATHCLAARSFIVFTAPVFARDIGSFDRILNVNGPLDLEVATNSGRIVVRPGNAGTIQIHAVISASDDVSSPDVRDIEVNPPIQQTGNSIRIRPLDNDRFRRIAIAYDLLVPAQTKLRAATGSGGIRVSGVDDEVHAQTGSGGIELDTLKGRVEARTGSGGIRGNGLSGPITARAGSGGITLGLASTGGFDLRARTGSGRISVDPPITMQGVFSGRHEVEGKIRGGGPLVDVATGSGGVRIQ
jgi:hypothetical protein